ncbi:MAG: arylesterase [Saprospiraceae bacterium]|nr:arylesterase [Saprospiraceae bacterium]
MTAAYGIDPKMGYVSLIQQKLDNEKLDYKVINAGLSGETTAGGLERIDWILKQTIDVFVLELGGNDALRGIDPKNSYQNLKGIIEKVKAKYPDVKVVLAGMQAPPNMGKAYTDAFKNNYINLSKELNTALIPFLLENIGGIKDLNIKDGIHPNEKGQVIMAENVWKTLKTVL